MAARKFEIEFEGYWRECAISGIPSESGVYCAYECTHNVSEKNVSLHRLLYIGEADDVKDRVAKHEKWGQWKHETGEGNELCFSFARVGVLYRNRIEAALIFKHKPPVNDEYKWSFPFDETTLSLTGKNARLLTDFTVVRTE